jgi:hypothetical protein
MSTGCIHGPPASVSPTAMHKRALQVMFGFILVTLATRTLWAGTPEPVWQWSRLTTPSDNLWTIAGHVSLRASPIDALPPGHSMGTLLSSRTS